jgi:hypothetical protein
MFDAGGDGGDVEIFSVLVLSSGVLGLYRNFLRPVAFLIVFHRYVGERAKQYIASDILLRYNGRKVLGV